MKFFVRMFLVCLFVFTGSETKADGKFETFAGLRFSVLTSERHRLLFRGNPQTARARLHDLEGFYRDWYGVFFSESLQKKISITLYESSAVYRRQAKASGQQFGHFSRGRIVSFLDDNPGSLFHESIHAWLNANWAGAARPWFEEGLASYFESPQQTTRGWNFDAKNWRQAKLGENWTELRTFMRRVDLPEKHSKAQARMFFLWLAKEGLLADYVRVYLEYLDYDPSGMDALRGLTGRSIRSLDVEIRNFSRR